MVSIVSRYGTVLRCYDNGGKTCDRYTIIPPRWANEYREDKTFGFTAIGCNACPFQGIGYTCTANPGPHLGKRIKWADLPADVQKLARQTFPEYAPKG